MMLAVGFTLAISSEVGEIQQIYFISEAWLSMTGQGKPPILPPSAEPYRTEVLFISNLKADGYQASLVIFEMVREDEELVELKPYEATSEPQDHTAGMPLLDAFVAGYRRGASGRPN